MRKLFRGSFNRSLDAKGRLMLPPGFRDGLQAEGGDGTFWLTAYYGHLTAYLPDEWENIIEQLSRIRFPSPALSNFKSKVIGLAQEMIPDQQGRVRIPQPLMREAGLCKDVVLVGMLDKFEIWDQGRHDAIELTDVSAELAASGIEFSL
ncbi:division/cell wall cluster transcriptional repressor MraZ [uncultured Desulfovibrio sp.]|uniref:division/cell wall cluster transcriptional repressor MraZ n=1 Tax=uncultured Desulfovibrio sp. TaxID=167968 RepID=UPI0025F92940|nr:division/cell wall cluster transcriptional repressor MraZ [uncultured Desulfovibrio sp.]